MTSPTSPSQDISPLDSLTGGAFSAPTSGERSARLREWLSSEPAPEQLQEVFREMSSRDKGAARLLRERLDEIKRAKGQEAIGAEWAGKAEALLGQAKLNIADAMAWQRDAAKAGAPLSREPLARLKVQLADRVRSIEDLQHRVQVQREAAVLLAQRIEVLSTKSWRDAQAASDALRQDVPDWQSQAQSLMNDAGWSSIDPRFPPQLEASRQQLQAVWEAFQNALGLASAAAQDPAAPLPPVPVWADEVRAGRGLPAEPGAAGRGPDTRSEGASRPPREKVDPQRRALAQEVVRGALTRLEQEVALGHGKASASAAAALRVALKEHARLIDPPLEQQVQTALAAAGEIEGWQRWRADQLRQELVTQAEGLFETVELERKPRLGGRKMQEQLRAMREQWKLVDQGGVPNHALWKRFDEACNEAYRVVQAWLDKVKTEAAEHRARRVALVDELKAWALDNPTARDGDWKGFARVLHQFESRWREAGHLSEKAFAEMQPTWREALQTAEAPLVAMQKQSLERRHAMIGEATALGAATALRVDAVRALQQRWQMEAQTVPLDRRQEQKLWDAFRKPIDEAFNRKDQERDRAASSLSERDRVVLEASRALEAANATGDAHKIREAMAALEAALRGQAEAREAVAREKVKPAAPAAPSAPATPAEATASGEMAVSDQPEPGAPSEAPGEAAAEAEATAAPTPVAAPRPAVVRPVVAMRGDDRPGMKKTEPAPPGRGGKPGERRPSGPGMGMGMGGRFGAGPRPGARDEDRGPRLGDTAFRAQRDALEHAQAALRKLAAQAHGEALTHLLAAWEHRAADQVPSQSEWGKAVAPAVRGAWVKALGAAPAGDAAQALLRLEMAAQVPTPAEHLDARRSLQLQLLTRRNDPAPAQTWGQDVAQVLASAFEPAQARRLQAVLKTLLRP